MSRSEIAHTLIIKKPDSGQDITLKPGGLSYKKHPELFDSGTQTTLISTLIASRAEALGLCLQCNTLRDESTSTICETCGESVDFANLFWCLTCFHLMQPQGSGICSRCGSEKVEGPLWEVAQQRLREDADDSMDRYGYQYSERLLAAAPQPTDVTSKQIDQAASRVSARQQSPSEIMAALPVPPPPTKNSNQGAYREVPIGGLNMATDSPTRLAWEPPTMWRYNLFTIEYVNKGGFRQSEGWSQEDADRLNELGELGWEAVNLTRLNDTQFLILMKLAVPRHLGAYDVEATQTLMDQELERALHLFNP